MFLLPRLPDQCSLGPHPKQQHMSTSSQTALQEWQGTVGPATFGVWALCWAYLQPNLFRRSRRICGSGPWKPWVPEWRGSSRVATSSHIQENQGCTTSWRFSFHGKAHGEVFMLSSNCVEFSQNFVEFPHQWDTPSHGASLCCWGIVRQWSAWTTVKAWKWRDARQHRMACHQTLVLQSTCLVLLNLVHGTGLSRVPTVPCIRLLPLKVSPKLHFGRYWCDNLVVQTLSKAKIWRAKARNSRANKRPGCQAMACVGVCDCKDHLIFWLRKLRLWPGAGAVSLAGGRAGIAAPTAARTG